MMIGNALANLVIFRARNLHLSYAIGWIFAALDVLLVSFGGAGSISSQPQAFCRISSTVFMGSGGGHALAKLNPERLTG
jgi:hypothetical protein